jgi:hypothetical protein
VVLGSGGVAITLALGVVAGLLYVATKSIAPEVRP